MKDLVQNLNTRYNSVLQSTSDPEFYQNIHEYIDFIIKNPTLSKIIETAEEDYHEKHYEIWQPPTKEEKEYKLRSERVAKLERFSLFASNYATIFMRIYIPIESYKITNAPDNEQDLVALLMLKGIKNVPISNRWDKKTLKIYDRKYKNKRAFYENKLRRFHSAFIAEVQKIGLVSKKPKIEFDRKNSIMKLDDKIVKIKQKNDKPNCHYVLEYIFDNPNGLNTPSDYSDIIKIKFPLEEVNNLSIWRACKAINQKVSEQAGLGKFLIIKAGKYGYTQINPDYL